jgi:hypothetical protein
VASAANLESRNVLLFPTSEKSCCRCKQTISPAKQWFLTCQFEAFVDMQYFLKQLCRLSLIKLHIVQGVKNALITAFSSLTTKLGRCHPNVCTAETGSQLLTATSYTQGRPIEARVLVLNFAANADITRASDPSCPAMRE